MKKIINSRTYDTTKATEVGSWDNGLGPRDFRNCAETLYRKRTGEFFLYGEGGPMSKYRRAVDQNSWRGGEDIKPLTVEEARRWAEENLSADEYEAEFGEVAEDDSRTVLSITMATSLAERLLREAAKAEMTLSAYIESKLR